MSSTELAVILAIQTKNLRPWEWEDGMAASKALLTVLVNEEISALKNRIKSYEKQRQLQKWRRMNTQWPTQETSCRTLEKSSRLPVSQLPRNPSFSLGFLPEHVLKNSFISLIGLQHYINKQTLEECLFLIQASEIRLFNTKELWRI